MEMGYGIEILLGIARTDRSYAKCASGHCQWLHIAVWKCNYSLRAQDGKTLWNILAILDTLLTRQIKMGRCWSSVIGLGWESGTDKLIVIGFDLKNASFPHLLSNVNSFRGKNWARLVCRVVVLCLDWMDSGFLGCKQTKISLVIDFMRNVWVNFAMFNYKL